MRRSLVSTSGLMGLVLGSAIGIAALRSASRPWARSILVATLVLLGVAIAEAITSRCRRGRWGGAALFGGSYLALSLAPGLSTTIAPRLPTTTALEWLSPILHVPKTESVRLPRDRFDESFSTWSRANPHVHDYWLVFAEEDYATVRLTWKTSKVDAFRTIGQCLWALFFAALGGILGGIATRKASTTPHGDRRPGGWADQSETA